MCAQDSFLRGGEGTIRGPSAMGSQGAAPPVPSWWWEVGIEMPPGEDPAEAAWGLERAGSGVTGAYEGLPVARGGFR